jgi:hypothetical protein
MRAGRAFGRNPLRRRMIDRELEVQAVGIGDIKRYAVAMINYHGLKGRRFEAALDLLLTRRVGYLQRQMNERRVRAIIFSAKPAPRPTSPTALRGADGPTKYRASPDPQGRLTRATYLLYRLPVTAAGRPR